MASTLKDLTSSASRFVITSLDNVKEFLDRTADEVAKADVVGANRRIADQLIEGTKETVNRVADSASKSDPMNAVLHLATGTLENARETVRVASEETQRINLLETASSVTQEGLDLVRRQVELSFDAGREVGNMVGRLAPVTNLGSNPSSRPPGVITRVEIESDKGTIKTETAHATHAKK